MRRTIVRALLAALAAYVVARVVGMVGRKLLTPEILRAFSEPLAYAIGGGFLVLAVKSAGTRARFWLAVVTVQFDRVHREAVYWAELNYRGKFYQRSPRSQRRVEAVPKLSCSTDEKGRGKMEQDGRTTESNRTPTRR